MAMLQGLREVSVAQIYPIGMRYAEGDRVARYCRADEAIVIPNLGVANGDTLHFMNTAVAGFVGDTTITVVIDPADAAYAVDQFKDGYITIHTGVIQHCLKIRNNPASDGVNVLLRLAEPLLVDTPLPTFVELHENQYRSIVVMNAAGLQTVVAVPFVPVALGSHFWGQTWGPCLCTAAVGGGIGAVANERSAYFQDDGGVGCATDLPPANGFQFAGVVIPTTSRLGIAADSIHFMLQLAP